MGMAKERCYSVDEENVEGESKELKDSSNSSSKDVGRCLRTKHGFLFFMINVLS